jgi:hypothetical protein
MNKRLFITSQCKDCALNGTPSCDGIRKEKPAIITRPDLYKKLVNTL